MKTNDANGRAIESVFCQIPGCYTFCKPSQRMRCSDNSTRNETDDWAWLSQGIHSQRCFFPDVLRYTRRRP